MRRSVFEREEKRWNVPKRMKTRLFIECENGTEAKMIETYE